MCAHRTYSAVAERYRGESYPFCQRTARIGTCITNLIATTTEVKYNGQCGGVTDELLRGYFTIGAAFPSNAEQSEGLGVQRVNSVSYTASTAQGQSWLHTRSRADRTG